MKKLNLAVKDSEGNKKEVTAYYNVSAGVPAASKPNETCDYCNRHRKVLHQDTLEFGDMTIDNAPVTDEALQKKIKTAVKRKLPGVNKKYCLTEKCTNKHHDEIAGVEAQE